MWQVILKYGISIVLGVASAYVVYRNYESNRPHERNIPLPVCVICNHIILPEQMFENWCHCKMHIGCIRSLQSEGQNICPKCRSKLQIPSYNNMN